MRRLWLIVGIVGALAVAAVITYLLALRDTATPVDPTDLTVVEAGSAPGDPGVYRYATTGFEEVDALAGARHDYPTETYLTIGAGPCGTMARWDALVERWVEWDHCGPAFAVTGTRGYHEWFGVPDLEHESCPEPLPLVPDAAVSVAGVTGDTTETYTITPLGAEDLVEAGATVTTDHVRVSSVLSGATSGAANVEVWVLPGTVLVVRTTVDRHTTSPSRIGDVHYDEIYTLMLVSLTPG
ncbi:MAG: hypothetical protein HZA58_08910 [Acidimicrobiia bacterium]|nr:hypothetical protein [Acidimicrobiia bacterium]